MHFTPSVISYGSISCYC